MFSSIFGKRRSSPVEVEVEEETPPIPGARQDDGFVVVDPSSPRNSLYPNVSGVGASVPYPQRPAPAAPSPRKALIDPTFHYLQGVPFTMSKTLQMASSKDSFATELADLLAFLTNKVSVSSYDYDFSVEKSVLKEC
uniref:UMA domain-containing protein n=1 Tax=Heliothis virescens TaxID=7102 RepID=A0A2A4K6R7_HELVI